ncbi:uncharacterized protein OCT59_025157 [Rhizophagus irregularis]|uniref:uncharacterized protein n=1 Tax=Rhizophagus irregularis TaxID=588596 RepID=UPI0033182648|nr:hypothetical protein OCT59_025157 [Rhizophagus irregularis]
MRKKLDQASSSSQSAIVESDTVVIATGRKVIKFSADGELLSIIWTANPKADDYNELPTFVGGEKKTPKEIRNLVIVRCRLSITNQQGYIGLGGAYQGLVWVNQVGI